jgi:hypothetical protein
MSSIVDPSSDRHDDTLETSSGGIQLKVNHDSDQMHVRFILYREHVSDPNAPSCLKVILVEHPMTPLGNRIVYW